jgi:cell shape-determining protein MreD
MRRNLNLLGAVATVFAVPVAMVAMPNADIRTGAGLAQFLVLGVVLLATAGLVTCLLGEVVNAA